MSGSAADVVDYDPIQFYEDPYPMYRHLRDEAPIGAPLARMESRIAFEEFFTRVPNYEIVGPLTRLFTRREQRGIASLPGRLETGSR